MAERIVGRLKPKQVTHAKPRAGKDRVDIPDGGNLYLQATRSQKSGHIRRSWVFKYELAGIRHELGLGATHTVRLAEAREKARALRQTLLDNIDPLEQRQRQRAELLAGRAERHTFKQDAEAYIKLHESGWSVKHAKEWRSTLQRFVYSRLASMPVKDITSADVMRVVEPHWIERTVTAGRVLDRIGAVLDYSTARGHRSGDNPCSSLRASLPKQSKVAAVEHHAAIPYQDIGALMADLEAIKTPASRALQLLILCGSRMSEVRGATRSEIDLDAAIWTIPAARMKGRRLHRVPLSSQAVAILKAMPREGERIFDIGVVGMEQTLKRIRKGITTHGMRSSLRTWCLEQTSFAPAIVEAALAHKLGKDTTEQAYIRGDLFERRRKLMQAWADFCTKRAPAGATITPLRREVRG